MAEASVAALCGTRALLNGEYRLNLADFNYGNPSKSIYAAPKPEMTTISCKVRELEAHQFSHPRTGINEIRALSARLLQNKYVYVGATSVTGSSL
jgi:hypothetical protein